MTRQDDDKRFLKWCKWLRRLQHDLILGLHNRELWQGTVAAIREAHPGPAGMWMLHYNRLYGDSQIMMLRRTVRSKPRKPSLETLLNEIGKYPNVLSSDRYVALQDPEYRAALGHIIPWWHGEDAKQNEEVARYVSGAADLKRALFDKLDAAVAYADHFVAHIDLVTGEPPMTFELLDEALMFMQKTFLDMTSVVTGIEFTDLVPSMPGDWQEPFYEPLFPRPS